MSFLSCNPIVFVIGDEYEILLFLKRKGIVKIQISNEEFYENNSGVLSSEKDYVKIRVPQSILDEKQLYKVIFRECFERKAYFSEMGVEEEKSFNFKSLKKEENINIYHIADVHYRFETALKTASYFGDDLDLFIVNGDIGEVETMDDYFNVAKYVGDVTNGMIPVVFVRGNHDTRGKLAEKFTEIFPSNNCKTFYEFTVGPLSGIALDCGEDKWDNHEEYNGVNVFERYRLEETKFLKNLKSRDSLVNFAISHICPFQTTLNEGDIFDIERELYTVWHEELIRLNTKFMLCGHIHKAYVLDKNSPKSLIKNNFPIIVGSEVSKDDLLGCAITLNKYDILVRFTNKDHKIKEEILLKI